MVRLPGVSSGCATCRKRKKGCDRTRPQCRRCTKAGLPCGGYREDIVWVQTAAPGDAFRDAESFLARDPTPPDCLTRSARQQLYYGAFSDGMLPGGRQYSSDAIKFASVGWLNLIDRLRWSEAALQHASISIGTLLLALDAQDSQLRVKSIQTYNRAICEVAKALKGADWYQRDGLMATARLLSFYEVMVPAVDKSQMLAWRGHNEGTGAMFLARGPHAFTSGAAHQLFIDARINLAIVQIGKRQRSPFGTREWNTVPWSIHRKSVKDELIDLVQELPAILEQVVAFRALERVGATKHLEMRIIAQCNQLHRDFETWTQKVPDVLTFDYTQAKPPLLAPRDDAGISLLHLSEIYWIALMILYSVLNFFTKRQNGHKPRGTEQSVAQHNKDDRGGTLTRVPLSTSPDLHASKCVHAIHLYWGEKSGVIERIAGLLALSFAMRYYLNEKSTEHNGDEMEVLQRILDIKLFGSDVRSLVMKVSGGSAVVDAIDRGTRLPGDEMSWF